MNRLHAKDVHPDLFKANAHPGLWMDRFCPEFAICDQKQQRGHLDEVCTLKPAAGEYASLRRRHEAACRAAAPIHHALPLTLRWRLAIHLSRASALENAATCLHPVYGFAYLPGSGLKGLARAYASLLWDRCGGHAGKPIEGVPAHQFQERFLAIFGWAPNDERQGTAMKTAAGVEALRDPAFGGHTEASAAQRGGVTFHDAWAVDYPRLDVDVSTCHYQQYYSNQDAPGDWQEPTPHPFLAVEPETKFLFLISGADQPLVDQALQWLFGGLYWMGAGAKTAAGYGSFGWDEAKQRQEQERAQAEEAAAAKRAQAAAEAAAVQRQQEQAAQGLLGLAASLKPNEVLVVPVPSDPSQPASRSGYTLMVDNGAWKRGPAFVLGKNAAQLSRGLVFTVIKKGTTNDKGQIEVQGPCLPTGAAAPV